MREVEFIVSREYTKPVYLMHVNGEFFLLLKIEYPLSEDMIKTNYQYYNYYAKEK